MSKYINCCICNALMDPKIDEFNIMLFRDKDSNKMIRNVSNYCMSIFESMFGHQLYCFSCGDHIQARDRCTIIEFVHFKNQVIIMTCKNDCIRRAMKELRQIQTLELKLNCVCGKTDKTMKKCSRCKLVYYCSKECQ